MYELRETRTHHTQKTSDTKTCINTNTKQQKHVNNQEHNVNTFKTNVKHTKTNVRHTKTNVNPNVTMS